VRTQYLTVILEQSEKLVDDFMMVHSFTAIFGTSFYSRHLPVAAVHQGSPVSAWIHCSDFEVNSVLQQWLHQPHSINHKLLTPDTP
jgi:hypothetical protein